VSIALRSFAKINLGLKIGSPRPDGFHELRTIYQTIALHDVVRVEAAEGEGIEIHCDDPRVPCDSSNTCWKIATRVLKATARHNKVVITIEKHLPVQGGLGAASSNGVATMLGLEHALGIELTPQDKLAIAAEVGSDLPLFLIGGTVLGVDRGQEVYPLQDLPEIALVVVTPSTGVSTPKAFTRWDALASEAATDEALGVASYELAHSALTVPNVTGTIKEFDRAVYAWWSKGFLSQSVWAKVPASGVPAAGGDRAETPLLDLVQTGIENDFERVVLRVYPELPEGMNGLQREGAGLASLSGSGSTLYGLFDSGDSAEAAAARIRAAGHATVATRTVGRAEYWKRLVIVDS
jgi:4-diphosphocytidyl-2-C-methyl-D-erythritol kinase